MYRCTNAEETHQRKSLEYMVSHQKCFICMCVYVGEKEEAGKKTGS